MTPSPILDRLKADLLVARKTHNGVKSAAIQSVLAEISNKEAAPVQQKAYQVNIGVGSTEVARRVLSDKDIQQIIQDEVDEIKKAIDGIGEDAHHEYVTELKQKLAILAAYLA